MIYEQLRSYRIKKGLSQEKIAELLGVSRQAVTKWEAGQTIPSSDHLIALAKLYEVSLDELVGSPEHMDEEAEKTSKKNPILRANVTRIAIICQVAFLNATIQRPGEFQTLLEQSVWALFTLVPLLASSIWMAYNLRYEPDMDQRKKNSRIELLYCVIQLMIALVGYYTRWYFATAILLMVVCLVYIFKINPQYMNRQLVRKKKKHDDLSTQA